MCWLQQDKRIKGFCEPKELQEVKWSLLFQFSLLKLKRYVILVVVAHAFNPALWKQRQVVIRVQGQPGYTVRPCLKIKTNNNNKTLKARQTNAQHALS